MGWQILNFILHILNKISLWELFKSIVNFDAFVFTNWVTELQVLWIVLCFSSIFKAFYACYIFSFQ